eukprot:1135485-Prymnesium_polylepis.1
MAAGLCAAVAACGGATDGAAAAVGGASVGAAAGGGEDDSNCGKSRFRASNGEPVKVKRTKRSSDMTRENNW